MGTADQNEKHENPADTIKIKRDPKGALAKKKERAKRALTFK